MSAEGRVACIWGWFPVLVAMLVTVLWLPRLPTCADWL
jgi:hypothetical protein